MTKEKLYELLHLYSITVVDFAKYLGITRQSLYARIQNETIPDYWVDNLAMLGLRKHNKLIIPSTAKQCRVEINMEV